MTSSYGERINPVLDKNEFHNGIDLAVNVGTKIKAVFYGEVSETGVSPTYGNYVKYMTEDNFTIMYAHLDEVLVAVNDTIEKGQIIALSGNTGLSTGAHLHVAIWKNEKLVDPTEFFSFAYTDGVRKEYEQRGIIIE